jgi:predicted RNA binding protein YcfA (HicA-like mRNA interferase family)
MALAKALNRVGYSITRQTGSHIRLTLPLIPQQHVTVPAYQPLKVGTLAAILDEVAVRLELDRAELLKRLAL